VATARFGHFYFSRPDFMFLQGSAGRKGWFMPYWIHCDRQAQIGDLRRVQILTSDELSLREDLRGPFNSLNEAFKIAETLIWSIVADIMDRLRTEQPRKFATFPSAPPKADDE
jgi:hypothetical protein